MARMRTILQAVNQIREQDPGSSISEHWLRCLVRSGKLPCHRAGAKYLVDLDALEDFLVNPPREASPVVPEYGKLRQIKA